VVQDSCHGTGVDKFCLSQSFFVSELQGDCLLACLLAGWLAGLFVSRGLGNDN
jgi:hypothetical protein